MSRDALGIAAAILIGAALIGGAILRTGPREEELLLLRGELAAREALWRTR